MPTGPAGTPGQPFDIQLDVPAGGYVVTANVDAANFSSTMPASPVCKVALGSDPTAIFPAGGGQIAFRCNNNILGANAMYLRRGWLTAIKVGSLNHA